MNDVATVPVTITPEAAERIAQLGFEVEVERMVEHAKQTLPQIRGIEVSLWDRYEAGDQPGLAVNVYSARPYNPDEKISWELRGRIVRLFPAEVLEYLNI